MNRHEITSINGLERVLNRPNISAFGNANLKRLAL